MNKESSFNLNPKTTLLSNKRQSLCNIFGILDPIKNDSDLDQEIFDLISRGICNLSDPESISKNYNSLTFDKILKDAENKYKTSLSKLVIFDNDSLSVLDSNTLKKLNSYDDFITLKNSQLSLTELSNLNFNDLSSVQKDHVINNFISSPDFIDFKEFISDELLYKLSDNGFICEDRSILNINQDNLFSIEICLDNIKCSASYFAEKCQENGSEFFDGSLSDYGASGEFNLNDYPEDLKYVLNGDLDERINDIIDNSYEDFDFASQDTLLNECCEELHQMTQDCFNSMHRDFYSSYESALLESLNKYFNDNHQQLIQDIFKNKKSEVKYNKNNSIKH